jgi:hypothetical protein
LNNKIFSFYLTRNDNRLILGDLKLKNKIYQFVDVSIDFIELNLWKIELEHFYVGGVDFCKTYKEAGNK